MSASSLTTADFLSFKRMVTPIIIKVLFWFGIACCVIGAIGLVAADFRNFLGGLAVLIVGPLMIRVYCEIFILSFIMNDTLTDIRNLLSAREKAAGSAL